MSAPQYKANSSRPMGGQPGSSEAFQVGRSQAPTSGLAPIDIAAYSTHTSKSTSAASGPSSASFTASAKDASASSATRPSAKQSPASRRTALSRPTSTRFTSLRPTSTRSTSLRPTGTKDDGSKTSWPTSEDKAEQGVDARLSRAKANRAKSSSRRYITLAINFTIILTALALVAVLVYPAMQNWWKVRRDIQLLQTESDAVIQRNNEIQSKIDDLETPEGIESRAREEFGWVYPGEDAVNINGLGSHNSSTALPDSIPPGSLRPDIDWVTETLDFIFGYEYPSTPPASDDVIIGL